MNSFNKMTVYGNSYNINSRRPFEPINSFCDEILVDVFDFAYEMTFGAEGEHRDHRSGGRIRRRKGEIFANTFQGKLAEFAMYLQLNESVNISEPDLSTYGLGQWDVTDLEIGNNKISVKSTKHFGNLLLLEFRDWNEFGEYIPNNAVYDFTFLVRLNPNCEDLMRSRRIFYSDNVNYNELKELILNECWDYDIPGFITLPELRCIIREGYIIPQRAMLNGRIPMDADNYYVQAGDMHPVDEILDYIN